MFQFIYLAYYPVGMERS